MPQTTYREKGIVLIADALSMLALPALAVLLQTDASLRPSWSIGACLLTFFVGYLLHAYHISTQHPYRDLLQKGVEIAVAYGASRLLMTGSLFGNIPHYGIVSEVLLGVVLFPALRLVSYSILVPLLSTFQVTPIRPVEGATAHETVSSSLFAQAREKVTTTTTTVKEKVADLVAAPQPIAQNIERKLIETNGDFDMYQTFGKRLLDLLIGLVGTIFLVVPLTIVFGIYYQFGRDKGPIFFTQTRMGKGGKPFKIIKFRSMVVNAEELLEKDPELRATYVANGYKFPEGKDPRLTKIGGFIRKTSLDEFPQFVNILKGEMSFIGPRPILEAELQEYTEEEQKELLSVKPGATGWWQVSGRSDVQYPERCELELYYPRNASLALDGKILLLTVKRVLTGKGAH